MNRAHIKMKMKEFANSKSCEVEKSYSPEITGILEQQGFTEIRKMPFHSIFDFIAKKEDKNVFVEVKTRSGDNKFFTLRASKLKRLGELEETSGDVFLLFINKLSYQLLTLKDFLKGDFVDNKYIRVSVHDDGTEEIYKDCWFIKRKSKIRTLARKSRLPEKVHVSVRLPKQVYDAIREEIDSGNSDNETQVIKKALWERFQLTPQRRDRIRVKGKKVHISIWVEGWMYNKIQDEIEVEESESEGEVVRKALSDRFKGAW